MSVNVVLLRVIVEAAELAGVAREELLRAAVLTPERLQNSSGRVSNEEYERVQLAALELTKNEALALHIGEQSQFAGFDVIPSLLAHAETLRDALHTYFRFQAILFDGPSSALQEEGETAILRYEFNRGKLRCERFNAELGNAGLLRMLRHHAGPGVHVRRVFFEYAAPGHAAEYARIFKGAERFGNGFTGMEFDVALLDCRSVHADPGMYRMFEDQAVGRLERVTRETSFSSQVVEYLAASPSGARLEMSTVAQHFNISERSLRRRLCEEGVTYSQLVERALGSIAQRLLQDPKQSISETAYALGFSTPSAFHRAFKRWTGETPNGYRKRP
jgi:AraC-like DNA-binding protein